jgi:MFS transporter, DHA1 family, tetracycline resistance protein
LLDIIWIAVIIPAFPELKAYYGINDFQVTLWLTIYSLFAFLSAPLLGQISDKIGRKKSLVRCVFGTFLSYLVLLITKQYRIFLLSRIINGITWGNVSILQAILTDISPDKETKAKNFWLMGAIFWLWFIIGPVIGALILRFGNVSTIFAFGALFALLEVILIAVKFNNTNVLDTAKKLTYNSFTVMWKYLKKPELRNFIVSLGLLGIGTFTINASQSLYMNNLFGTTGEHYGYFLAIIWVLSALNLWLIVPKFWLKRFTPRQVIMVSHITLIIWYILIWLSQNFTLFVAFFYVTMILWNIYMPVYNIEIMSKAKLNEIWEISWMLGWRQSMVMFIWPLIWWILLNYHINIFIGAVICFVLSLAVMSRYFVKATRSKE